MDRSPARKDVDIFLKRMENPYAVSFFWERYPHMGYRQIDDTSISGSLPSGRYFLIIAVRKQRTETAMPLDAEEMIQLLLKTNKEQEQTITDLRATIKDLRSTIANLNETLDELKRKLFGSSSEKTKASQPVEETVPEAEPTTIVKEHKRVRKKKSVRADLYEGPFP